MEHLITWRMDKPSTMQGFSISVTHTFSSFNFEDIQDLAEELKQTIGTGIVIKGGVDNGN